MSEFLESAAQVVGAPAELVQRSAEARAAADGVSVDEVLQAWAGGGSAPAPSPAQASEPAQAA
ncbi:MAG: HpaF protein, partial [bacterium]|nr:HpaF protein [bacterium]